MVACSKSQEPKKQPEAIPQGTSLDQPPAEAGAPQPAPTASPQTATPNVQTAPEKFPQVDPSFVPQTPQPPAGGLPTAADLPAPREVSGYQSVGFAKLAGYLYETEAAIAGAHTPPGLEKQKKEQGPPKKGDEQIPPQIKALDGQNITVQGFMVPIDFRRGQTNEFILVSVIPSCFFCQVPMPNQWIEVKMKDAQRVPYPGDGLITVAGKISIGALYEGEYLRNLYRLEGHQVVEHQ